MANEVMHHAVMLPDIKLTPEDADRLERLANAGRSQFPETSQFLVEEISRARIVNALEREFVRIGSEVQFRDDATQQVHRVIVDLPQTADISTGRISVLTPIGVALIGLSAGQSMTWKTPSGSERSLTVLAVSDRMAASSAD